MPGLDDALERIRGFLESRLPGFLDAPGAVLGLTDRERLLGVIPAGLADAFTGAPMEEHTRSEIGSISKSFGAVVALQEVEKGTLDLHSPVTDYVPWFEVRTPYGPITTHHLLTHTSGLIMGMDFADDAIPAVESLRHTSTGFAPGERFLYSNDAYKLVGLILEMVTGSTIRDLLRERILEPLGMSDSDPAITFESRMNVATGHQRISEDRPPHRGMPRVAAPPIISTTADGSIISTAADMAAYARMLLNRSDTGRGERLLEETSFELFTRPAIEIADEPGVAYAYGLDVFEIGGRAYIGHSGGMVGYYALLECDVDTGLGAVMMVNGLAERKEVVRFALSVLRAWKQGEPLPEIPPARDPERVKGAESIAGRYRSGDRGLVLGAFDGKLFVDSGGVQVALMPDEDRHDRFVVPHAGFDRFHLKFERNGDEVVALVHGTDRFVRDGREEPAPAEPPRMWVSVAGLYRTYNPWAAGFRVYLRGDRLFLSWPDGERELELLDDGEFRVGEAWSPDRVRFETIVEGRPQQAVYNGYPYWRSFVE
ncbi:MAG: beta-lactamase family protein [Actinomycetota bacterium]|nr:beta-lactamase family protein [Actinomycetota bacterium]